MNKYLQRPIQHVDITSGMNISSMARSFSTASFQARNLSRCVEVYRRMLADEETIIFLGLSGAMVPGGMRKIIADMIRNHYVDVIVSTGANLFHDFFEARGYHHYLADTEIGDLELKEARIDRIYDTVASDTEFEETEKSIAEIASRFEQKIYSSREFLGLLAGEIEENGSILGTARQEGLPIFCPALCDSAIGIALTYHYIRSNGRKRLIIDQIRDNFEILQIKRKAPKTGVLYLGGGVPKNYIQQLTPMLDAYGPGVKGEGHSYYIQLTMDDPKWGGLSGCTPSEAMSWGKMANGWVSATAFVDATIGLPFLAAAVMGESNPRPKRARRSFTWNGDRLEDLRIADLSTGHP